MDMVFRRSSEMNNLAHQLGQDLDADNPDATASEIVVDTPVAKFLQTMFEDAVQIGSDATGTQACDCRHETL